MFLDYTPEQKALQEEIRAYMADLMSDELRDELHETEGGGPLYFAAMEKLAADKWLGIGWPKDVGGQGRGPIEQFIFFDEVQAAGFPVPILTLNTVGPPLIKFGSDEQRAKYLPRVLEGKCHFSIGYSEPGAGTDLASLKTKAVREGDEYVINGQKTWTSLADHADYLWLAVRTDPDVAKHKGISIIIVPVETEGVALTPISVLGDNNIHTVYLENVRVPVSNLVGDENAGWRLITTQLNHERVALNAVGPIRRLRDDTIAWAKETDAGGGKKVIDLPWVQANLARIDAKLEVLLLLNWQQAWGIAENRLHPADASAIKVYGSEFYVEGSRLLLEILGEGGILKRGSAGAIIKGQVEKFYRISLVLTFGGGTNEVQRDIIAQAGLRMPRLGR